MSIIENPVSPLWMDKRLLALWLRTQYGEVAVAECEVENASSTGDNYMSVMHRMVARTPGGDSHYLLIKSRMEEGTTASVMKESSIFRKEQELYAVTLPKLHALLHKAMPGNFKPLAPKCIYASESFLVLEDLSPAGFRMLDRRQGLDLDHCLLVMRSLAMFHAASAVLHKQDPDSLKEYEVSFYSDPVVAKTWPLFSSGMSRTLAEELDSWSDEWRTYADRLRDNANLLLMRVQEAVRREEADFNVLIHGDLWVNNILFRDHTNEVRLVDFQMSHFTSPVIDLHYFMATSTTLQVRMEHEQELLQEYHIALCEALNALGYTPTPISLEKLREDFDRKMIYGLYSMIAPYAIMQSEPEYGFSFDDIIDTGSNPGPCMYGENYKAVVRWFLPLLESKGVFDRN